jgi:hypothetical protein
VGDVTFQKLNVPGLDDDESAALNTNLERLLGCRRRNFKRSCLYDGKNAMSKSSVVPDQYYKLGIALGWSAKAVDGLTRRAQLEQFTWTDGDLESLGMDVLERENALLSEVTQALSDSALHGVSFLVSTQGGEGEPVSLIHARDALSATGTWSNRVRRLTDALSVTKWNADDDKRPDEFTLYLDDLTITVEQVDGKWQVDRSEHTWGVPVEPLVYKPRPSRRYGQSRLTRPIMGLHMQAVRELIRGEGHMDIYSYPEFWLLGGDMSSFKNADGSQKAVWQVMLGRYKGIEDNDQKPDNLARVDVKQFPAASPEPHTKWLATLSRAFAREASLPDSAVALEGMSNPTSADSYDASQYELIAEAEGAMRDWRTPITRAVARSLAILNGEEGIPSRFLSIRPDWLGAKFESRAAKADAGSKQIAAVPWLAETEVGLEMLGLTPDQIKRAVSERRRAAGRDVIAALAARGAAPADANGQ